MASTPDFPVQAGPFTRTEARRFTPADEVRPDQAAPQPPRRAVNPNRAAAIGLVLSCALVALVTPTLSSVSMFASTPVDAASEVDWMGDAAASIGDAAGPAGDAGETVGDAPSIEVCPRHAVEDEIDAAIGSSTASSSSLEGWFGGSC